MTSRLRHFRDKAIAGIAAVAVGFGILVVSAAVPGCGVTMDDEARILEMVERLRALAEKRDTAAIMELIHEDYEDFQGRNRDKARSFIDDHFRRYRGIVIHLLKAEVLDEVEAGIREVRIDVLLSSGIAETLRRAVRFAGETYRIELTVVRDVRDEWRILGASWRPVASEDMLPGSREALNELFPDVIRNIF
jgi:hypothetical protein